MKKIFALLLSIWIPIYLTFGLLASCEKSSDSEPILLNSPSSTQQVNKTQDQAKTLTGTWQLKEYFQDNGNGQGSWVPAQNAEQVSFSENGDFSANEFFPLYSRHFNKYRIVDSAHVELYSTESADNVIYISIREGETSMLFNPVCRENCARRYSLIQ